MRVLIASDDADLTVALHFRLREEPGFRVVGSVTSVSELAAVGMAADIDVLLLDSALGLTAQDLRTMLPDAPPPVVLVLAIGGAPVDYGDVVVHKGGSPSELIDALIQVRARNR